MPKAQALLDDLTPPQRSAFENVRAQARDHRPVARLMLRDMAARWSIPRKRIEDAIVSLEEQAQIVCHFHPDRICADGLSVAEGLLHDGRYKNQFETGISNGILDAPSGGQRDLWETRLFAGAYRRTAATPVERPKYAALDFMGYSDGPVPFFGCCYFVLRAEVARRCTFTFGDSSDGGEVGVIGAMDGILAGLMNFVEGGCGLSLANLSVPALVSHLVYHQARRPRDPSQQAVGRVMQKYIEVQAHGTMDLASDVETLVVDPSFHGTATGEMLKSLSSRFAIPLRWHSGFSLAADRVPDNFSGPLMEEFRAPRMPALARRVADRGQLTAASLGRAADLLARRGKGRMGWSSSEALKDINHLWYLIVHFGDPHPAYARAMGGGAD